VVALNRLLYPALQNNASANALSGAERRVILFTIRTVATFGAPICRRGRRAFTHVAPRRRIVTDQPAGEHIAA